MVAIKYFAITFCMALITLPVLAQFKITSPIAAKLPKTIQYNGDIVKTAQWKDSLGSNVILLTETGVHDVDDDGNRSAALYALHYIANHDSAQLAWKVYDFIDDCPVDVEASFIKNTFAVTDLDHNGIAEIWMMYRVTCQGDVSPVPMKIIMYEGKQKYAARGNTRVKVSATKFMGGDYEFDDAFKKAPDAFRKYADELWQKHKMDKLQ